MRRSRTRLIGWLAVLALAAAAATAPVAAAAPRLYLVPAIGAEPLAPGSEVEASFNMFFWEAKATPQLRGECLVGQSGELLTNGRGTDRLSFPQLVLEKRCLPPPGTELSLLAGAGTLRVTVAGTASLTFKPKLKYEITGLGERCVYAIARMEGSFSPAEGFFALAGAATREVKASSAGCPVVLEADADSSLAAAGEIRAG
jgi:hypothetical protein